LGKPEDLPNNIIAAVFGGKTRAGQAILSIARFSPLFFPDCSVFYGY
jgi:hypothetical protein